MTNGKELGALPDQELAVSAVQAGGLDSDALRVLVCGGRDFDGWDLLQRELTALRVERGIGLGIVGGATGADALAQRWFEHARIPVAVFPANWRFVGKMAGPVRNASMLRFGQPGLVVAFPGGRGTADMVKQAIAAGIPVQRVSPHRTASDGQLQTREDPKPSDLPVIGAKTDG